MIIQTVTVSTKVRAVCLSPCFIWRKTVRGGELKAVVNLVDADFKPKSKDRTYKSILSIVSCN